jgi:hypothetical protein
MNQRRRALGMLAATALSPVLAACGGGGDGADGSSNPPSSASPWADDAMALANNIRGTHPDPAGIARSAPFQSLLAQILSNATSRTDKANLVELVRLAALMRDEHTRVNIADSTFNALPIRFAQASDGYWVTQATSEFASLLGAQLVAYDGVAVAELATRARPLISAATNAAAANLLPRLFLHLPEFLQLAGITSPPAPTSQSTLRLRDAAGNESNAVLTASASNALVDFFNRPGGPAAPLWLSQPARNYFSTTLPQQIVYARYARCAVDSTQSIDAFFNGIGQALAALPAPKLIFDLRNNGGGDSSLLANAVQSFANTTPPASRPALAVLVNNGTYSSATLNLFDLIQRLNARTFGESPGTAPNHAGEIRTSTLPRTNTTHICATRVFTLAPGSAAENYVPDTVVPYNVSQYVAGADPVLQSAVSFLNSR